MLFLILIWILATISAHLADTYTNQPIGGFLVGIIVFLFGYIVITVFRSKCKYNVSNRSDYNDK